MADVLALFRDEFRLSHECCCTRFPVAISSFYWVCTVVKRASESKLDAHQVTHVDHLGRSECTAAVCYYAGGEGVTAEDL